MSGGTSAIGRNLMAAAGEAGGDGGGDGGGSVAGEHRSLLRALKTNGLHFVQSHPGVTTRLAEEAA